MEKDCDCAWMKSDEFGEMPCRSNRRSAVEGICAQRGARFGKELICLQCFLADCNRWGPGRYAGSASQGWR